MVALQQFPFQRRRQDTRPDHGAAGFAFLDDQFQEEIVCGLDPLGSRVLSVNCDIRTACGLSSLGNFRCVLRGKYIKTVLIDDFLLPGCVE